MHLRRKKILTKKDIKVEFGNIVTDIPYDEDKHVDEGFSYTIAKSNAKKYLNKYFLQFFISSFIAIIFIFILIYQIYKSNKDENLSKELLKNYSLTTLYQNEEIYNTQSQSVIIENPFIIGILKIPKININYPILSESSDELLKIALCRFAGPMPNETGNLCIAGHNYLDDRFFGRLAELTDNDLIEIYDLSGQKVSYSVFDKYQINSDDFSCTNQNVGSEKIITLITCNNINGKRTLVKAKKLP